MNTIVYVLIGVGIVLGVQYITLKVVLGLFGQQNGYYETMNEEELQDYMNCMNGQADEENEEEATIGFKS